MLSTYRTWLIATALPFWGDAGFDRRAGRFHERLDAGGRPLPVPQRSMVQARQIATFAQGAHLGWFPEGAVLADTAMRALRRNFLTRADGTASFAFAVQPGGEVASDVRDAYGHAFVLFAIAWLHRVTGDASLLTLADETLAYMDRHMADEAHGGYHDQVPLGDGTKRQNPHMHLLEALLALDEGAPGRGYMERAAALVDLFKRRFFHDGHGVLLEHFGGDWLAHPEAAKQDVFEPGHHFEWVWLLDEFHRRGGESLEGISGQLYTSALATRTGGAPLVDEVGANGPVRKASHRLWPHTEAIKAAAVRHAAGHEDAAAFAQEMAGVLEQVFLGKPFPGGWVDHVDPGLQPLVSYVPASSLYHLMMAGMEAHRRFGPAG